ncbi:MAG: M20/M25/M40 family metallo-hydrolase [Ruminococcaceae bacterium]|nr:M20/M25/M40 family metallo-hydrolase [Oscillospiraceae bacterium]
MWILYLVLAVILLFLAVILIRTLCFKPTSQPKILNDEIFFDKEQSISALQQLIRCKTVSYYDSSLEDDAEFEKLIKLLPELYPNVFKVCEFKMLPDRALLFKWSGKGNEKPTVLMAHYDVVPVDEASWQKPPFDAVIEDGVLWGRGSLDTKVTFNGVLFAANTLINEGYIPENDIYFAFSGGEEVNGNGAANIVNYFKENGIEPALVVDEGGAVVENVFPGVKAPCAMVGIAEKGMLNLTFSVKSNGGHASSPAPHTPIGILSRACCKVENNPFKMHITKPAAEMFDTLGRHSSFVFRMIFANLWLFKGVLNIICKKSGGELNALLRTTVAFTQSEGSNAPNVIPPRATMTANLRLNPKDTVDSAVEYIRKTINNDNIELIIGSNMNPSRVSQTNCTAFNKVASAVANTWKGCIVSPYLMVQCSDSRHWGVISDKVYRFSAIDLTSEERKTIHGHNEKIRLETACSAVEFYIRLIKSC